MFREHPFPNMFLIYSLLLNHIKCEWVCGRRDLMIKFYHPAKDSRSQTKKPPRWMAIIDECKLLKTIMAEWPFWRECHRSIRYSAPCVNILIVVASLMEAQIFRFPDSSETVYGRSSAAHWPIPWRISGVTIIDIVGAVPKGIHANGWCLHSGRPAMLYVSSPKRYCC